MASIKWVVIGVILSVFGLCVIFSAPCTEDSCQDVQCTSFNNCDLVIPSATKCGCCEICIEYIEKGKPCTPFSGQADLAQPADRIRKHCGPQLVCDSSTKTCIENVPKKKCLQKLLNYENNKHQGWLQIGKIEPKCDKYGDYEPNQYQPGAMYFCVDKNGKQIFGESNGEEPLDQQCRCSRAIAELEELMKDTSLGTWTKTQGEKLKHFLRCSATGDYERLQCVDEKCFCLNTTLEQDGDTRDLKTFQRLHCFNPNIHSEKYYRPCELELMPKLEQIKAIESNGKIAVGFDLPDCDADGSYGPKQCIDDKCRCVNKDGETIENFEVQRYSDEEKHMKCRCAREKLFLAKNGLTKKLACTENGNYKEEQCLGSQCYCVDKYEGDQCGKEYDKFGNTRPTCDCEET